MCGVVASLVDENNRGAGSHDETHKCVDVLGKMQVCVRLCSQTCGNN
jgi:hypothetical protein